MGRYIIPTQIWGGRLHQPRFLMFHHPWFMLTKSVLIQYFYFCYKLTNQYLQDLELELKYTPILWSDDKIPMRRLEPQSALWTICNPDFHDNISKFDNLSPQTLFLCLNTSCPLVNHMSPESKSLYRSCAGSHFYGTEYEIWADFGPAGNTGP